MPNKDKTEPKGKGPKDDHAKGKDKGKGEDSGKGSDTGEKKVTKKTTKK